jgi:hypothetical protein
MRLRQRAQFVIAAAFALGGAVALPSSVARAQERVPDARPDRPQAAAATAEAVANLRDQIEREPIGRDLTVGEVIRRSRGEDELTRALQGAELVGGPRWVDNDTCQVQLEISGTRAARSIQHIVTTSRERPPLSPDELSRLSTDWQRRTFTGSGSSTAFNRAAAVRPRLSANSPWSTVPDATRRKVLSSAKEDAINRVIDSIRPIEISKGKTVGDALDQPEVRRAVMDWLAVRPVIRIEYRLDSSVEITLAGTPNGLFDTVRHAVIEHSDLPIPRDEAGWAVVRHDFETRMAVPVGRSSAAGATTGPINAADMARGRFELPPRAPSWVRQRVDVEAVADLTESKLKCAREAEAAARRKLAAEINALPLTRGITIGKAAEQDPRVRDAVYAALDKARTTSTDYTHKKGVAVTLQLDLQDLWDALRGAE